MKNKIYERLIHSDQINIRVVVRKKFEDIDKEIIKKSAAEPDRWDFKEKRRIKGTILYVIPNQKEVDILDMNVGIPCCVDVPEKMTSLLSTIKVGERWELEVEIFTAEPTPEFRQFAQEMGAEDAVKAVGAKEGLNKLYRFVLVGAKKMS